MRLDNEYVSRYRTLPAASYTEELSEKAIPYLPHCRIGRDGDTGGENGIHTGADHFFLSTPMHYHPEAEILYVVSGEWQYRTASAKRFCTATAGDLVFFLPYEPHETAIRAGGGGYVTRCICFDTGLLAAVPGGQGAQLAEGLAGGGILTPSGQPLHITKEEDADGSLRRAFDGMLSALDAPGECEELMFFGALCTMFGILRQGGRFDAFTGAADVGHGDTSVPDRRFARSVIDYTEAHYAEHLTTAAVSAALNYSEAYFCRMFRRIFHLCYSDYVSRLRVAKVRPLLGTMSVTAAAVACGFTHMSRFSKVFRQYTGLSPTEYRKLLKKEE
ncbi:MAG: helix-turn-helix transcriptional regulator [Clostridia bacterium]|nr:helix-turn-helix transcriptional regulator [Clostridia bacterium]